MSVTVDMPDEVASRLQAEALRRGITVSRLLAEVSEGFPTVDLPSQPDLGFIGMGSSATGQTSEDIDEMLADGFGTN